MASVWCKINYSLDTPLPMHVEAFPNTLNYIRDLVTINLFSLKMFIAGWETRAFSDVAVRL